MIDKKEVKHIAELARMGLSEKEIEKFQKELSSILDYFEALDEVKADVEPTFHPVERFFEKKLEIMREDKAYPEEIERVEKIKSLFPDSVKGYLKVKSILKK